MVDRILALPANTRLVLYAPYVRGKKGEYKKQLAQMAKEGFIRARIDGRPTTPFRYVDKGSMATIGRNYGIAELPSGVELTGFVGWLAWLGLHLLYLIGFRNRANVLVNWAWNYLTYDRGSRLLEEQDIAKEPV